MGTPYIDINSTAFLRNISKPKEKYAEIKYHGRGWTANSYFRVEGKVYVDSELVITFEGKWSESVTMTDKRTGISEIVWTKNPYPDNWEKQYGMTHHSM
jgi:Oxysterol-binding protein